MQTEMNKRTIYKEGWRVKNSYHGYVVKRIWNNRHKGEWITQHRYNMEQCLDRKLLKSEIVHHIDMDKTNNDINNLWYCTRSQHKIAHNSFNSLCALGMKEAIQFEFNRELGKYCLKEII